MVLSSLDSLMIFLIHWTVTSANYSTTKNIQPLHRYMSIIHQVHGPSHLSGDLFCVHALSQMKVVSSQEGLHPRPQSHLTTRQPWVSLKKFHLSLLLVLIWLFPSTVVIVNCIFLCKVLCCRICQRNCNSLSSTAN